MGTLARAGEAVVMKNACWNVVLRDGTVESLHMATKAGGALGRNLVFRPLRFTRESAPVVVAAAFDGDTLRIWPSEGSKGPVILTWRIDLGPDGYYDRLTGTTYDGLVDGVPRRAERQDHPALLRFISGAKGHTYTIESMKRMDPGKLHWSLSNPGGRTVIILTADGTELSLDYGDGGSVVFGFEDGYAQAVFTSPRGVFTLKPYDGSKGIVLENGARLPRFRFGASPVLKTSTGGEVPLNTLFDQFYLHATFWYPGGHGVSAWAAWGPLGHAYVDAPYRTESRNAVASQVVSDDGYGHDGYAWSWGDQPGWPFPGGYDTRHFGINAMHIFGAATYLLWTGEYEAISGMDFVLRGMKADQTVFAQDVDQRQVRLREGAVLAQPFRIDQPIDRLLLHMNVPRPDPRFDEASVPDLAKDQDDRGRASHPFMISTLPEGRLAQRFRAEKPFDTVGVRLCCWAKPGSGLRVRVLPWRGDLASSLAAVPLGEMGIESVPDNQYGFVTLKAPQPAETEALLVVDRPKPPAPGKEATGGVWGMAWKKEDGDSGLFHGNQPVPGYRVAVATGNRRHPSLTVRIVNASGKEVAATRVSDALPKDIGDVEIRADLSPGAYTVEARGNGAPLYWRASTLRTALGGKATENGHGWDWIERARREMAYQMDILNAREKHLLLLDGKAGDRDHSGVTGVTVGDNYYDILPFGYYDAYTNAWFYASLRAMAGLERAYGDPARAEQWEALMPRVRARYNEVFWTVDGHLDGASRYVGCIDATGASHDYGFSFVNTLAVEVGLASPAQAEAVLRWLDEGVSIYPDGTRRQDIYHFGFGPRTTTIDNPDWWAAHQRYEAYPFGDQIQNGGADLYESYYDLRARIMTRGADDAYARLLALLRRYAEPDRLCGGKRLYTGDSIQGGGTAGGTGVLSFEFPETAILGGVLLYGFLGAEAKADGLHLTPRIPEAQPFIRAENILYHGDYFTFEASKTSLNVRCEAREGGYDFVVGGETRHAPFACEVPLDGKGEVVITPVASAGNP